MKFGAIATLLGVVSAIQMSAEIETQVAVETETETLVADKRQCIPRPSSNVLFDVIDSNHNKYLTPTELYGAIAEWARSTDQQLTEANVRFIQSHAAHDASKDGRNSTMNSNEFYIFINQFADYFHLKCVAPQHCVSHSESDALYSGIENKKSNLIGPVELYDAIRRWADHTGRHLTEE